MRRLLLLMLVAAVAAVGLAGTAEAEERYSSCAKLLKDYPRGVAKSASAAAAAVKEGSAKPSVRPALYRENGGRLDVDDDGVMCEQRAAAGTSSLTAPQKAFISEVHQRGETLAYVTDRTLIEGGRAVCQSLDAGGNFTEIIQLLTVAGIGAQDTAALIIAAVHNLCPGHTQFLTNFVGSVR